MRRLVASFQRRRELQCCSATARSELAAHAILACAMHAPSDYDRAGAEALRDASDLARLFLDAMSGLTAPGWTKSSIDSECAKAHGWWLFLQGRDGVPADVVDEPFPWV